jgi:LPS export ABC transporter protein LptC
MPRLSPQLARALSIPTLATLVVAGAACRDTKAPTLPARGAIPDSAEQVMFGLRHALTTAGVRRAQLHADTAFFYDEGNRIDLRVVRTTFYTAAGDSDAVMTGRRGVYDVRQQRLEGRGDVQIKTVAGRRLASQHLIYDKIVNQVSSDSAFTFNEPGRTLAGVGFRSDPQLRNLQVFSGAKGRAVIGAGGATRAPARTGARP